MSIFTENLSYEYDIDIAEVEKVWHEKRREVEEATGLKTVEFSPEEFMECEKRTRAYLEAESMIRVGHFFESDMDAGQFLETLVSGNFDIGNIVNKKKDEDLNDDDDYVLNEDSDEEEMLDEEEDSDYIDDEENGEEAVESNDEGEVVPDIMTEERARQILGAASGVSLGDGVPSFLR